MSYQVGYGRPPLHTRFRKGQSGNPGGQFPSGAFGAGAAPSRLPQDLQQVLLRALGRKMPLSREPSEAPVPASRSKGGRRRVTWREAIITRLIEQSAAGELHATRLLAELMWHCEPPPPSPAAEEDDPVERLIAEFDRLAAEREKEQQAAAAEIFAASW